jgi:3-dehydroquinate dehydratase / shikimate dehydrogenase
MLCVSIGRGRHKHVIAEQRHLAEEGAKLLELRLDYINGQVNIGRLLEGRPCPVIATVRRQRDGGKWIGSEDIRQMILRTAIAAGVEYVDLEEDIAASIPRFGPTKRIVSLHDFNKTPDDLDAIHARLASLDADIVKIATMANNPHDNLRMLRLVGEGIRSRPSESVWARWGRLLASLPRVSVLRSPFATFHPERELAPGLISFQQMRDLYRYEQINSKTEVYGVIADPVAQSLSPLIHNTVLGQVGLNKVYLPFRVPREDLDQFLKDCPELGVRGLSVTIPHKEAVVPKCSKVDGAVRGIGAANTLVYRDGEIWVSTRTFVRPWTAWSRRLENEVRAPCRARPHWCWVRAA